MSLIRVVLGIAASMDLEIEQLDVKTVFIHDDLEEEIYMELPEGFIIEGKEHQVCRLKKSLYGLKQAPRQWYKKFESFMTELGYRKAQPDHCMFTKRYARGDFIILLLYVGDMLIVGNGTKRIALLKTTLSKSFAIKDLGLVKKILGMKISDRSKKLHWLSQERYIEKVHERFNMQDARSITSPLAVHHKLSSEQCPSSKEEKEAMSHGVH
jgi:ATP-binding cassette subfamily B (MDR/TAP) protein 1